ncbi:MAG: SDR family oxidoreductase [Alphaproteobacteria bacterium]|nr:SDR family oxidoreductase [Alphaproteobacteria bacterium]
MAYDFNRLGPARGAKVLVCGGCGGIGRAIVRGCLDTGLDTTVFDLQRTHDQSPVPAGVRFIAFDAYDESSVRAAFATLAKTHPALDAIINLVGAGNSPGPLTTKDVKHFDEDISRNLRSAFLISKHGIPLLQHSGAGSLVHTASGVAVRPLKNVGAYAAAKGGLISLSKTLAIENAPKVRVNVVAPGGVTNKVKVSTAGAVGPGGLDVSEVTRMIPMARVSDPEDLVGPFLFLAGPMSAQMTGQVLHVNGGAVMP